MKQFVIQPRTDKFPDKFLGFSFIMTVKSLFNFLKIICFQYDIIHYILCCEALHISDFSSDFFRILFWQQSLEVPSSSIYWSRTLTYYIFKPSALHWMTIKGMLHKKFSLSIFEQTVL